MFETNIWNFEPADGSPAWAEVEGVPSLRLSAGDTHTVWPAVQPGPLDSAGGFRAHSIRVAFTVERAGAHVLNLQFTSERGPCPDIEVAIDGRRGIFHPTVVRADRTATGEPGPTAGPSHIRVPVPAEWLPVGAHTVTITTVLDEAAALGEHAGADHQVVLRSTEQLPDARSHYGTWFGAYIRWWSARLGRADDERHAEEESSGSVTLQPTPFFIASEGRETELIDCDVAWPAGAGRPTGVILEWNGQSVTMPPVPEDRDFGMFRWRFAATAFEATTDVRIASSLGSSTQEVTPCRKWQLHLIPHVHLDLGFTDAQGKVLELHCRNIDRALDLIDADSRFRFSVDGSVVAYEYERTRSRKQVDRMKQAIAAGSLGVNSFHSNFLTGVTSLEELFRSTEYARTLPVSERTHIRYANLTDVPTHSRAIPSVLAELGIDGFIGMSNHGRAATDTSDELHLMSPVRWQGPDGSEVLAHFADHYSQLRFIAADPQSLVGATNGLQRYLSRYERAEYAPMDLAIIGTHADNEDIADGDTGFVERWNAEFAWPRLRVSSFDEYLAAVAPLMDRLPLWRSESGSYWEDGVGSASRDFAQYRNSQVALPAAETFGALVSGLSEHLRVNRDELDRAWRDLSVASEHTFTWARSTSHPHAFAVEDQLGWKRRYIDDAQRIAIDEPRRQASQLATVAGLIGPGVLVYNPHAWLTDLDAEADLAEDVEIVGTEGVIAVEVISNCAGMRRVRFRVEQMQAHEWRYFTMSKGLITLPGGDGDPTGSHRVAVSGFGDAHNERIETDAWIVDLDSASGLPLRLYHRASGRELLDPECAHRLGQVVRAGAAPFSEAESQELSHPDAIHGHRRRRTLSIENFRYVPDPTPSNLVLESPHTAFVGSRRTPDGVRLRWEGRGTGIESLVMELLLRDTAPTCNLDIEFVKRPCLDMEAVYVAFPFAGTNPVVRYDRQLGWVEPRIDHGPGASNEWLSHTNAVSIASEEGEIIWTGRDAPLFSIGNVVRGVWPTKFTDGDARIYSYAMNNFWPCNVPPAQSGRQRFSYRFAVSDGFDPAKSGRQGRIARQDAHAVEILPLDQFAPSLQPTSRRASLGLVADSDAVDLQLLSEGDGQPIAQVLNLSDKPITVNVSIPKGYRIVDADAAASGSTYAADLPAFGVERVRLTRC